jgi:hypothetical protein
MYTAATEELDDAESAVKELLEKIDLSRLKKNSVGIVTCYSEFLDMGIIELLSKSVDFDIIGATTISNMSEGRPSRMMMTLSVLTSDDVDFACIMTDPLDEVQDAPLQKATKQAVDALGANPDLIITFAPLISHVSGEKIIKSLDKFIGGTPCFGLVCVDHKRDYSSASVFLNQKQEKTSMAMLCVKGNINPKFFYQSISDHKIQKQSGLVTKSDGNLLFEVNGKMVHDYLKTIGVSIIDNAEGINIVPFVINYNDGSGHVVRAIYDVQSNFVVCAGDVPEGSTISVASLDVDDIKYTAEKAINAAKDENENMLIFSCLSRTLALGVDYSAEMQHAAGLIKNEKEYVFCYVGGEICPMFDENGKLYNRFHNDTIIIMTF